MAFAVKIYGKGWMDYQQSLKIKLQQGRWDPNLLFGGIPPSPSRVLRSRFVSTAILVLLPRSASTMRTPTHAPLTC
jgi:hypothetical protein